MTCRKPMETLMSISLPPVQPLKDASLQQNSFRIWKMQAFNISNIDLRGVVSKCGKYPCSINIPTTIQSCFFPDSLSLGPQMWNSLTRPSPIIWADHRIEAKVETKFQEIRWMVEKSKSLVENGGFNIPWFEGFQPKVMQDFATIHSMLRVPFSGLIMNHDS